MIEYLHGQIVERNPAYVVLDLNGTGYYIHISLSTYTLLADQQKARLFVHEVIREDAYSLYGFHDPAERELFRLLLSVSGIGANTGILLLSSLSVNEMKKAIVSDDVNRLKSVKGIGLKTAQRIIVELKDKLAREPVSSDIFLSENNTIREEALSALVTLGFIKKNAEKVIDGIMKKTPEKSVEQVIKDALKLM
ncbi:MAG TPA: Holliday junction branch migration protein RuvA [Prolixibacteraceae bacterium]|nr:Holliday junction branch migration protein RuvA [Prolixibacteraceae bacterium]